MILTVHVGVNKWIALVPANILPVPTYPSAFENGIALYNIIEGGLITVGRRYRLD